MKELQKAELLTAVDIVAGFRLGNEKVILNAYKQVYGLIVGFVTKNSGSVAEGEELAWECMERFRQNCLKEGFELPTNFRRYMYGICKYAWMDRLEAKRRQQLKDLPVSQIDGEENGREHFFTNKLATEEEEVRLYAEEMLQIVKTEIEKMGKTCQTAFVLACFEDLTHQEIANQMGISVGASRKRLLDCRNKLKNILKTKYPTAMQEHDWMRKILF